MDGLYGIGSWLFDSRIEWRKRKRKNSGDSKVVRGSESTFERAYEKQIS